MGDPNKPGGNGADLRGNYGVIERTLISKFFKNVENTLESIVDDMDISDEMTEMMSEVVGETIKSKHFRERLKRRIEEMTSNEAFIERMAKRVVDKVMSS